jgi:hypothetical protein
MPERTAERLCKLRDAAICKFCVATILCALASATTVRAQTRRGHARAETTQESRARRASQPASTSSTSPAQSSSPDAAPSPSVQEDDADLVIIANVTAKELRFDAVPNPTVEFPGQPKRDTEWSAERTNLPPQVQPGVTYRNIGIRLKIVSRFADIDRIVAEALGEIPSSDDTTTTNSDAPPPTNAITNDAPNATNEAQPMMTNASATDSTRASGASRAATTRKKSAPRAARRMR